MAEIQLALVLRHLHGHYGVGELTALSDRELLERFVARREEAAFAGLVARHGPLVLATCRRILGDEHAAEDAFQATFLVLARKAASGRWQESVVGWLHEVARRVAARSLAGSARQGPPEEKVEEPMSSDDPVSTATSRELQSILEEEVGRLPEKYRLPVLLCYVEGATRAEAARQLGWREGTVAGRLARARSILGRRLARRGVLLSAVLLAALWAERSATAVPHRLAKDTVVAALAGAEGPVLGTAGLLADAVVRSMLATQVRRGAILLLALGLLFAGVSSFAMQQPPTEQETVASPLPTTPPRPEVIPTAPSLEHEATVNCAVFAPDGFTVASAGDDADAPVRIWDVATGKELRRFEIPGHVNACAFSPDGKFLAAGGEERTVHLWDAATGRVLRTLRKHPGPVTALAFSPDGGMLVSGATDQVVRLWDPATGNQIGRLPTRDNHAVLCLAFSRDGKTLAAGSANATGRADNLFLWDVATRRPIPTLANFGHNGAVRSVAFSRDGKTLVSGGMDGLVLRWEAATGGLLAEYRRRQGSVISPVQAVALSADGKTLVAGSVDRLVYFWDVETGRPCGCFSGHCSDPRPGRCLPGQSPGQPVLNLGGIYGGALCTPFWGVTSVAFSPDSRLLVSGGSDHRVRLLDVTTGAEQSPGDARPRSP
jgi:RNA polymerase sigma factor (sigma-70 family)